jgi:hypothetical protein
MLNVVLARDNSDAQALYNHIRTVALLLDRITTSEFLKSLLPDIWNIPVVRNFNR